MRLIDVAHTNVVTVQTRDSIDRAISLMEEHCFHHLPVMTNGTPIGMLSDRDILVSVGGLLSRERVSGESRPKLIGPQFVGHIMSTPLIALPPDARLDTAGQMMLDRRIHAVAIVADNNLIGLVTETDLLRCYIDDKFAVQGGWKHRHIGDHFTANVQCLGPHQPLAAAARLMHQEKIRHVPVVDGHQLRGMVTDRDVRRAIGQHLIDESTELRQWPPALFDSKLEEVMTEPVETIALDSGLAESADRMLELGIGALPVVQDKHLAGIQTETDLLRVLVEACG